MGTRDIVPLLLMVLAVTGVMYMRIRFPSPRKIEELSARIVVILLFLFLSASLLMSR